MVRACGFVLLLACVPALADPAGDAAGHQAADRGRRPLGEDARRPAPLRRAEDRRVGRGRGRASGSATPPPGRPTRSRSGPTASRSGRSSASSTRACPPRWSASATTTTRPWWPRTTPSGSTRCAGPSWRASTARACCSSRRARCGASVIALPDADQTPEQVAGLAPGVAPGSQFARRLAANGFRVVVPTLISRGIDVLREPAGRDDQPAAPRVDLPPGVPHGPARHRLRGAEGPRRGGLDRRPGRGPDRRSASPATARAG